MGLIRWSMCVAVITFVSCPAGLKKRLGSSLSWPAAESAVRAHVVQALANVNRQSGEVYAFLCVPRSLRYRRNSVCSCSFCIELLTSFRNIMFLCYHMYACPYSRLPTPVNAVIQCHGSTAGSRYEEEFSVHASGTTTCIVVKQADGKVQVA